MNNLPLLEIAIGEEDDDTYNIYIIDQFGKISYQLNIKKNGTIQKSSITTLSNDKNLANILKNYTEAVNQSLQKLFYLYNVYPNFFEYNPEIDTWDFNQIILPEHLVNWDQYERDVILKKIRESETEPSNTNTSKTTKKTANNKRKDVSLSEQAEKKRKVAITAAPKKSPKKEQKTVSGIMGQNSKYTPLRVMGSGTYSTVYLVQDNQGTTYVLKQIKKNAKNYQDQQKLNLELDNIAREIDILKHLISKCKRTKGTHSYFPCYVEDLEDADHVYIITEYEGDFENLEDFLNKKRLTIDQMQEIFLNLVRGLEELHNLGVIHKDIKPSNIIIDPDTLNVQYIDFGLSCWSSEPECANKGRGTPLYISPEVYYRLYHLSEDPSIPPYPIKVLKASDVWALGMVFFVIYNRYHPFYQFRDQESLALHMIDIHDGKAKVPVDSIGDFLLQEVVSKMLEGNWKNRASLTELEKLLK